jgi:hypothetical protein
MRRRSSTDGGGALAREGVPDAFDVERLVEDLWASPRVLHEHQRTFARLPEPMSGDVEDGDVAAVGAAVGLPLVQGVHYGLPVRRADALGMVAIDQFLLRLGRSEQEADGPERGLRRPVAGLVVAEPRGEAQGGYRRCGEVGQSEGAVRIHADPDDDRMRPRAPIAPGLLVPQRHGHAGTTPRARVRSMAAAIPSRATCAPKPHRSAFT